MKAYIVLERYENYNDEYYYFDGDGGIPVEAYKDKAKAEAACKAKSLEWCREVLREFADSEFWRHEDMTSILGYNEELKRQEYQDAVDNPDDDKKVAFVLDALLKNHYTPYYVVEVDVE